MGQQRVRYADPEFSFVGSSHSGTSSAVGTGTLTSFFDRRGHYTFFSDEFRFCIVRGTLRCDGTGAYAFATSDYGGQFRDFFRVFGSTTFVASFCFRYVVVVGFTHCMGVTIFFLVDVGGTVYGYFTSYNFCVTSFFWYKIGLWDGYQGDDPCGTFIYQAQRGYRYGFIFGRFCCLLSGFTGFSVPSDLGALCVFNTMPIVYGSTPFF